MIELQERVEKLENMCKAKYEAGEKSQAYQQFTEKYSTVSSENQTRLERWDIM